MNDDNFKVRDSGKTLFLDNGNILRLEVLDVHNKNANNFVVPLIAWLPWVLSLYLFWQNKLLLGILLAIGFTIILIVFRMLFVPVPRKKMTADEFEQKYGELPKSAIIASIIGFLSITIGSIGAWFHNFPITVLFGIVITFLMWAMLQTNRYPKTESVQKSQIKKAGS